MPEPERERDKVFVGIAVTVMAVWTFATLVNVIDPSRAIPTYVNLLAAAVVGSVVGGGVTAIAKRRNGKGDDDAP